MLLLLLGLVACTTPAQPPPPAGVRPDLDRRWFDGSGQIRWPQNAGFASAPVLVQLPPGLLIDRFGSASGHFFSPKGASFSARALPYVCADQPYMAFRVTGPVMAWAGTAAPWFGEPGGATQFETDASAASLLADGIIETLSSRVSPPC